MPDQPRNRAIEQKARSIIEYARDGGPPGTRADGLGVQLEELRALLDIPAELSSTVKVDEIRVCPNGTYNIVLEGAKFDLNFTGQALVDLGVLTELRNSGGEFVGYGSAPDVRWVTPNEQAQPGVREAMPQPVAASVGVDRHAVVEGDPWSTTSLDGIISELRRRIDLAACGTSNATRVSAPFLRRVLGEMIDHVDRRSGTSVDVHGWSMDDNAEEPLSRDAIEEATGIVADLAATTTIGEYQDLRGRARLWVGAEQPAGDPQVVDGRPEPSRTVAFEDLYRYAPIIRRADTLYHAVQWFSRNGADNFKDMKRFVDEHSVCDFSIHHQGTTDRLIIRRHDGSVPITMEMGEWLVAEVETGQLAAVTPAEYNARYCEAP